MLALRDLKMVGWSRDDEDDAAVARQVTLLMRILPTTPPSCVKLTLSSTSTYSMDDSILAELDFLSAIPLSIKDLAVDHFSPFPFPYLLSSFSSPTFLPHLRSFTCSHWCVDGDSEGIDKLTALLKEQRPELNCDWHWY